MKFGNTGLSVLVSSLIVLVIPYYLFFLFLVKPIFGLPMLLFTTLSVFLTINDWRVFIPDLPSININKYIYIWVLIIIYAWVLFSGAGGYSYQTADYGMHNGRIKDLIEYSRPVIYPDNKPLVYYFAYYMPAATIGKFFGYDFAFRAILYWNYLLVVLAVAWTILCLKKVSILSLLSFIFLVACLPLALRSGR